MAMVNFKSFRGVVTQIEDFSIGQNGEREGCYKLMTVVDDTGGIVNFVISPSTYFVNQEIVTLRDRITGYYDGDALVPLISHLNIVHSSLLRKITFKMLKSTFSIAN